MAYDVYHRNVDGAGPVRLGIGTFAEARAFADEEQARSDSRAYELPDGSHVFNPYLYEYTVFAHGRTEPIYRTSTAAPRGSFRVAS